MELVSEYLVIIEKKASAEAFFYLCDSVEEFNRLLQKNSDIHIKNQTIKHKHDLSCKFQVKTGEVEGKDQRFFQIRFTFNGNEEQVDSYSSLLRTVKSVIYGAGGQPETLWDDVSFYYSQKSYPLIHKVENLMRKLITYFMLTNIGKEWVSENLPLGIQDSINKSKRKQYLDVLHQIDFKDLSDILFKSYQSSSITDLYNKLGDIENLEDLDLDDLQSFIPKSNWERYFSEYVECEDTYLKKRWDNLYELRCMVAHNALVAKSNYESIVLLVTEVEEKLQKAIDNLDKIHVPEEDKEEVAENIASNLNALYGGFIQSWKIFEVDLEKTVNYLGIDTESPRRLKSPFSTAHLLYKEKIIDDEMLSECRALIQFRNKLVHDPTISFSESEVGGYVARLEAFINELKEAARKRSTWKAELANVLSTLGGQASLSEIYDYIESNTFRELPDTWKATVRYNLQLNSADTETYNRGGEDLFVRRERGHWALKESLEQNNDITNSKQE